MTVERQTKSCLNIWSLGNILHLRLSARKGFQIHPLLSHPLKKLKPKIGYGFSATAAKRSATASENYSSDFRKSLTSASKSDFPKLRKRFSLKFLRGFRNTSHLGLSVSVPNTPPAFQPSEELKSREKGFRNASHLGLSVERVPNPAPSAQPPPAFQPSQEIKGRERYEFPPTAVNFPIGNSERKLFLRLPKEFDFYLQTRFPEIEKNASRFNSSEIFEILRIWGYQWGKGTKSPQPSNPLKN
ncbi:hypothetical protein CEXT_451121 [Caerostris extrusa]|uniref:Uncharacterized protein n=1 Tax=Caerostris extrusa TaxID=172846 RepID=A0AAV4Y6G7_CAEEX|nr:hypothetical protein CEXT_451121 [Caerostris extrusa]